MQVSFSEYCSKDIGRYHFQSNVVRVYADIISEYYCKGLCKYHFQSTVVRV